MENVTLTKGAVAGDTLDLNSNFTDNGAINTPSSRHAARLTGVAKPDGKWSQDGDGVFRSGKASDQLDMFGSKAQVLRAAKTEESRSSVSSEHEAPLLKAEDSGYDGEGVQADWADITNPAFENDDATDTKSAGTLYVNMPSEESGAFTNVDLDADEQKLDIANGHRTSGPATDRPPSYRDVSYLGDKNNETFGLVSLSSLTVSPRNNRKQFAETELQNFADDPHESDKECPDIHFQATGAQLKHGVSFNVPPPPDEKGGGTDGGAGYGSGGVEEDIQMEPTTVEPGDPQPSLSPLRQLLSLWYVAVIVLTPLVLLPIPLVLGTSEAKCAYVIFVMAIFWVSEAIPIPVTSLMPIFLLPMMGLLTARKTSAAYINDTSILFLGGLTVAIAIERWNLHRRIALSVMMVVGAEPRWLMLGMMSVTWFLSMWISNTATTAMMLPIVSAVLEQIADPNKTETPDEISPDPVKKHKRSLKDRLLRRDRTEFNPKPKSAKKSKKQMSSGQLEKALSLAIAYSANVGGIGSLTGTGPNLVLLGQSQIIFEQYGLNTPITFASWLVYGLPLSLMLVIVVWIWLQIVFLRCRSGCDCIFKRGSKADKDGRSQKVKAVIREEFKKLGPVTYAEGTIMFFFGILVVLWITRDLGGVGGWGRLFREGFVSDSTPAILTSVLMFILPSSLPDILFRSRRNAAGPRRPLKALMDWKTLHDKMPWSLYLLLGGGFAIALAAQESGLSQWLGEKLGVFGPLDPWLILLIICYIVTFATEVTSNTAIATLMMPILAQLSLTLGVNPLFFMFPTAITTSFAFMLPVATPPNAIVFAFGAVRVVDMAMCGFILNLVSVPCLMLATITWGNAYFHFDVLPPEFGLLHNSTTDFPPNSTLIV